MNGPRPAGAPVHAHAIVVAAFVLAGCSAGDGDVVIPVGGLDASAPRDAAAELTPMGDGATARPRRRAVPRLDAAVLRAAVAGGGDRWTITAPVVPSPRDEPQRQDGRPHG
jgi:hypothetical protein